MENKKQHIDSFIEGLKKDEEGVNGQNPFDVPDGYFDSLSGEIFTKIESISDEEESRIDAIEPTLWKKFLNFWMNPKIAISFALLPVALTLVFFIASSNIDNTYIGYINDLKEEEITAYIEDNMDQFEDILLTDETILSSLNESQILESIDLSDDLFEEYLLEEFSEEDLNDFL